MEDVNTVDALMQLAVAIKNGNSEEVKKAIAKLRQANDNHFFRQLYVHMRELLQPNHNHTIHMNHIKTPSFFNIKKGPEKQNIDPQYHSIN